MANGSNMRGNTTARMTQQSLNSVSGTGLLRETTSLQAQVTSPSLQSEAYAARDKTSSAAPGEPLHISILAHDTPGGERQTARTKHNIN